MLLRVGRHVCFGAVLVVTALPGLKPVPLGDHLEHYWDGREAYRNAKYRESVVFLDRAIGLKPQEGERVRWTGTHFETYLPHFHLGRALFALGKYEAAGRSWNESLRQGSILERGNKREHKELVERLQEMRDSRFPAELSRVESEIERTVGELAEVRGGGGEDADFGAVDARLASAREQLTRAAASRDFGSLEQADRAVREARARLSDEVGRQDERRREAERLEQSAGAVEAYREAARAVDDGTCSPDAIARLEQVLSRDPLPATIDGQPPRPLVLLADAHERCSQTLSAESYLRVAIDRGDTDPASAERLRQLVLARLEGQSSDSRVEPAAAGERAWSDYIAAKLRLEVRGCDAAARSAFEETRAAALSNAAPNAAAVIDPPLDLARALRACNERRRALEALEQARRSSVHSPDAIAALEAWLRRGSALDVYRESDALVVGVAHYAAPGWVALPDVLTDLEEIRRTLLAQGFAVQQLVDPTTKQLQEALQTFFAKKRVPESRLVFYYAGHGHTESNAYLDLGYIVPADTPAPGSQARVDYLRHLISMDRFDGLARATPARHAMFAFDSCFSGTIFNATETRFQMRHRTLSDPSASLTRPVRLFVTAGDETEKVPAKSAFRAAVVQGLEGSADDDADGLILGAELGRFVSDNGASLSNTPQWGVLEGWSSDPGDLAFRNPGPSTSNATLEVELALWEIVFEAPRVGGLRSYLARYPGGRFAALAQSMIETRESSTTSRRIAVDQSRPR